MSVSLLSRYCDTSRWSDTRAKEQEISSCKSKLRLTDTYTLHRASGLIPANMIGKDLEEKDPGKPDDGQRLEKFAKADTWFSVSSFV